MNRISETRAERPVARIYLRKNLSDATVAKVRESLEAPGRGTFSISPVEGWTVVEVIRTADLDMLRERFKNLIDGWRLLS